MSRSGSFCFCSFAHYPSHDVTQLVCCYIGGHGTRRGLNTHCLVPSITPERENGRHGQYSGDSPAHPRDSGAQPVPQDPAGGCGPAMGQGQGQSRATASIPPLGLYAPPSGFPGERTWRVAGRLSLGPEQDEGRGKKPATRVFWEQLGSPAGHGPLAPAAQPRRRPGPPLSVRNAVINLV